MDDADLERGLAVLEALVMRDPPVPAIVDALESLFDGPDAVREVLTTAERRGLIEREAKRIRPGPNHTPPSDRTRSIHTKEGEFTCRRCGQHLSTGYFVSVATEELGPYGSTCVRKLTGRA